MLGSEQEGTVAEHPAGRGPGDRGCKDLSRPDYTALAISLTLTLWAERMEGPWGLRYQGQSGGWGYRQSSFSPPPRLQAASLALPHPLQGPSSPQLPSLPPERHS